jgi:hypothetical protein
VINAPVLFSDSGVIAPSKIWTPDTDKMQSLTRDVVQIEEMRVHITSNNSRAVSVAALLQMQLQCGRYPITNQFVPLTGLDATIERYWGDSVLVSAGNQSSLMSNIRWRFPRPLALDIGQPLVPQFKWITPSGGTVSADASPNLTVNVAFLGRTLAAMPKKVCVPYVSTYLGRLNGSESKDTDLMNLCSNDLNVTGLGIDALVSSGGSDDGWSGDFPSGGGGQNAAVIANSAYTTAMQTRLKIFDQDNFYLVPFYTSMLALAGPRQFMATPGYVLPKRGYLRVMGDAIASASFVPVVSLNGWREEVAQ